MNSKIIATSFLAIACSLALHAEMDVNIQADIHLGKVAPPPPPEVIVLENAPPPGPPPWAPAHGFHRNHTYYYYPGCDVYYRPEDRVWFFIDGGNWRASASLPTNIRVDFHRAVPLTMETDRPYQFHEKVRAYYPTDYFVARVRVKDSDDHHEQAEHGDDNDHDHDHGKKGKGKAKGHDN